MHLAENQARLERMVHEVAEATRLGKAPSHIMTWAEIAGLSGWFAHAGRYVHRDLEHHLHQVAHRLPEGALQSDDQLPRSAQDGRRFLHVLTEAYELGGHTRLVERWIRKTQDAHTRHSIVVTQQIASTLPAWLGEAARDAGGELIVWPRHLTLEERAIRLRRLAHEWADVVILHVHPHDSVPSVAFGMEGGPPVLLMNHADHVFWIGSGSTDVVIDLRPPGRELTLTRRYARRSMFGRIPLLDKQPLDKRSCRQALGLPDDAIVLLTIGSGFKYTPFGELDFPRAAADLLRHHPNAVLLAVGPAAHQASWEKASAETNGRVRAVGSQKGIERYYGAADLFLEGFPMTSPTACYDAVLRGLPVVRAPKPIAPIQSIESFAGMNGNPPDLTSYVHLVSDLIEDAELRHEMALQQRQSVFDAHVGNGWEQDYQALLDALPTRHTVGYGVPDDTLEPVDPYDAIWATMQHWDDSYKHLYNSLTKYRQIFISKG